MSLRHTCFSLYGKKTFPGKKKMTDKFSLELDPELAAGEIVLAQFARSYRTRFALGYPTRGEPDLRHVIQLLQAEIATPKTANHATLTLVRLWKIYLQRVGKGGSVTHFAEIWLPEYRSVADVIPFPRRSA